MFWLLGGGGTGEKRDDGKLRETVRESLSLEEEGGGKVCSFGLSFNDRPPLLGLFSELSRCEMPSPLSLSAVHFEMLLP